MSRKLGSFLKEFVRSANRLRTNGELLRTASTENVTLIWMVTALATGGGRSISTRLFLFWGNWINEDNSGRNLDNLDKEKQIRFQIIPAVSKMNPSDQSGDYSFHPFPSFLNGNIAIKITINHF